MHATTGANGARYWYAWRGGPRLPDPADWPAHVAAYSSALASRAEAAAPVERRGRTLADIIAAYRDSLEFGRLAASTQREYGRELARAAEALGDMPVRALAAKGARGEVISWRDSRAATPRAADYGVEVLSAALAWAELRGIAPANPASGIPSIHRANRREIIWEPWEAALLLAAATPAARLAIALAISTGLRRGDLVALEWRHVADGLIEKPTAKSGGSTSAVLPITPLAALVLDRCPRTCDAVLTNSEGRPWTVNGLSSAFADARAVCGVPKRFHDLRGTAATAYAALGLAPHEIAPLMGWETANVERIISRYVSRRAVAKALADRLRG